MTSSCGRPAPPHVHLWVPWQRERRAGRGKSLWLSAGRAAGYCADAASSLPPSLSPSLPCCLQEKPPPLVYPSRSSSPSHPPAQPIRVLSGGRALENNHSSAELLHLPRANRELAARREETRSNPASVCACVFKCVCVKL